MKNEMNVESLLEMVKGLSKADQSSLADRIMQMMASPSATSEEKKLQRNLCKDMGVSDCNERPDCPHCAAKAGILCFFLPNSKRQSNWTLPLCLWNHAD